MKLKHKLNRMKHHMSHDGTETPAEPEQEKQQPKYQQDIPFQTEWENMNAVPLYLDDQYVLRREEQYSLDDRHGSRRLGDIFQVFDRWAQETADHPLKPEGRRPQDLLFFDTETTGLNSGAGNMIYLLGGAWLSEDRVHVTQYFLPGPESEAAFYYHFLTEMEHSIHHLATYNGKAFDWPQVKTRHTFVRHEVPKLPEFGHFDLLHAARRLFKRVLPSCRLSVVEEEILGLHRENDTPGYLAPMLYFDYLKEQDPAFIEGVIGHNEQDVLSLISLYIELSERVLEGGTTPEETYEIGRWFEQMKEWSKASWCYQKAIRTSTEWDAGYAYALALVLKKQKQTADALPYLENVWKHRGRHAADAAVELAKYMEHEYKDAEKALYFTEEAFTLAKNTELRDDLEKRRKRLTGKIRPGK
ncbi:ribonuclease H-like domain-containing protein [Salibacterium lacus]|uniref:Ribonuclease H-like domain-containing protein n=1 Tax=Salibacterium lacus TaxID=1898109 RepID=A0ABW5SXT6_9BACI